MSVKFFFSTLMSKYEQQIGTSEITADVQSDVLSYCYRPGNFCVFISCLVDNGLLQAWPHFDQAMLLLIQII